ncbi:unnamed protein product [Prorocentrum cordatum]|uniref:Uncharacterized protein n=1 Tax=Prorocentrum cordatum TaxID=2364126 RepID=A0ABN9XG49_9DINO|nr:unnamed protein product [Polarella glacialis]
MSGALRRAPPQKQPHSSGEAPLLCVAGGGGWAEDPERSAELPGGGLAPPDGLRRARRPLQTKEDGPAGCQSVARRRGKEEEGEGGRGDDEGEEDEEEVGAASTATTPDAAPWRRGTASTAPRRARAIPEGATGWRSLRVVHGGDRVPAVFLLATPILDSTPCTWRQGSREG